MPPIKLPLQTQNLSLNAKVNFLKNLLLLTLLAIFHVGALSENHFNINTDLKENEELVEFEEFEEFEEYNGNFFDRNGDDHHTYFIATKVIGWVLTFTLPKMLGYVQTYPFWVIIHHGIDQWQSLLQDFQCSHVHLFATDPSPPLL